MFKFAVFYKFIISYVRSTGSFEAVWKAQCQHFE